MTSIGMTAIVTWMDVLDIVFLVTGIVGIVGGTVVAWIAMRTATRVAVKIVTRSLGSIDAADAVAERVAVLEQWRRELERIAEVSELGKRVSTQQADEEYGQSLRPAHQRAL